MPKQIFPGDVEVVLGVPPNAREVEKLIPMGKELEFSEVSYAKFGRMYLGTIALSPDKTAYVLVPIDDDSQDH